MAKKNVAILEGEKSRLFEGVEALQTEEVGGGTVIWIPEGHKKLKKFKITNKILEEIEIGKSKIGKMGGTKKYPKFIFEAEKQKDSDGEKYFGFSKVTVALKAKKPKVGRHPTDTSGNEHAISTDDSGNIKDEVIPSKIKITTKPEKLTYKDKEKIDIKGIVVKAYTNDNQIWDKELEYAEGIIPPKYLTLDPEKVDINKILPPDVNYPSYKDEGDYTITSLGSPTAIIENSLARMYKFEDKCGLMDAIHNLVANYPNSPFEVYLRTNRDNSKGWSPLNVTVYPDLKKGDKIRAGGWYRCVFIATYGVKNTLEEPWVFERYSIDDTGYESRLEIGFRKYNEDETGYDVHTCSIDAIVEKEGGQEITVKWARPQDGKELTDKYRVSVNEKKNNNNNDDWEYEGYPTH